jgi:hypothetical protein
MAKKQIDRLTNETKGIMIELTASTSTPTIDKQIDKLASENIRVTQLTANTRLVNAHASITAYS